LTSCNHLYCFTAPPSTPPPSTPLPSTPPPSTPLPLLLLLLTCHVAARQHRGAPHPNSHPTFTRNPSPPNPPPLPPSPLPSPQTPRFVVTTYGSRSLAERLLVDAVALCIVGVHRRDTGLALLLAKYYYYYYSPPTIAATLYAAVRYGMLPQYGKMPRYGMLPPPPSPPLPPPSRY
jgi:hypothetical protein